jgi:hypothetical protein
MEFGLFIILSGVAAFGFFRRTLLLLGLSIAICFAIALILSTGDTITQQETSAENITVRNATGDLESTSNSTTTKTMNVLGESQNLVSMIFYAFGALASLLFMVKVLGGWEYN